MANVCKACSSFSRNFAAFRFCRNYLVRNQKPFNILFCSRSFSKSPALGYLRADLLNSNLSGSSNHRTLTVECNYGIHRNLSSHNRSSKGNQRNKFFELGSKEYIDDEDFSEEEFHMEPPTRKLQSRKSESVRANKHIAKDSIFSQKTGSGQVRPSRYLFKDLQAGDEEGMRWMKRGTGPTGARRRVEWYANQMLKLTNQNQVVKAEEMLHSMRDEKIKPTPEVFNILISGFGKAGKIRKAFHYYNQIKKMGLKPTPHSYTSLFTCYAATPYKTHTLEQVTKLWNELHLRINTEDIKPQLITYNSAINSFAACGSPEKAFEVYEDMLANEVQPDGFTSAALLNACARMGAEGPTKALWVLQEMKDCSVKPDIFVFNLVLRVIRDAKFATLKNKVPVPGIQTKRNVEEKKQDLKANMGIQENVSQIEGITEKLFAGPENFLQLMAMNEVTPDIRTFHLLLQVSPEDFHVEELVLRLMDECSIKPDVVVLNTLVKRRSFVRDLAVAKEYIKIFNSKYDVVPSEQTYECLAIGCHIRQEGFWLLSEIEVSGRAATPFIYTKLISNALKREEYRYATDLLKKVRHDDVQPLDPIIQAVERSFNHRKGHKAKLENASRKTKKNIQFLQRQHRGFQGFYNKWKQELTEESETYGISIFEDEEDDNINYDHL